jgi:hypothetical protein
MAADNRRYAYAWLFLTAALAIHVLDEAANGFLGVYNPAVLAMRRALPWLPVPTFTFAVWITGLTLAIVALSALSPFAFHGRRWIRLASVPYAGFMTANGLGHIAGSLYVGDFLPGVYSSPLLIAASIYLWKAARISSALAARSAAATSAP